ncbi:Zn-dependent alcohol dehydrogenase [Conexibacter arvalis]|uniref:Zn-dependent alcohol dehydrogenase n=1 Tax=Conexibacter arvalis TaxID=912552 RepID=A0A840I6T8_9ACTN|nr:hypothetical protein [Conexibacter arvalis]MBB4660609.1 Zn-dependent alcohol dehydrogenase [Conexibacter arvalis]
MSSQQRVEAYGPPAPYPQPAAPDCADACAGIRAAAAAATSAATTIGANRRDANAASAAPAQQHGQRYVPRLLEHARRGDLDPSFLATHRMRLDDAPRGYELFKHKRDGCVRAVFAP